MRFKKTVAVAVLLPESRSSVRQRIDLVGVALSGGGLALLTYGVISAGERGVTDAAALPIAIRGVAKRYGGGGERDGHGGV